MRTRIVVREKLRIDLQGAPEAFAEEIRSIFTHRNPQHEVMRRLGKPWIEPREIATWRNEPNGILAVPRGGLSRVRDAAKRRGIDLHITDDRERGAPLKKRFPKHRVELRPYQTRIVDACLRRENCLIHAGTGAGKSTAGLAFAAVVGGPSMITVNNVGLFEQWIERAKKELGFRSDQIGMIRGRKQKLAPLTIAMLQTLHAGALTDEVKRYFRAFIFDEVQGAPAKTCFEVVDQIPARYRIGISADSARKDRKEFLTYDLFGSIAESISQDELIEDGFVLDVEARIIPTDFVADWYGMPEAGDPHREIDTDRLYKEMAGDSVRDQLVIDIALQEIAAGEQVLIFSHRREHCLAIERALMVRGTKTGALLGGEESRTEFRRTLAGLRTGEVRAAIGTYQAIGKGLDLPSVAVGIAVTPITSNKQVYGQARGRLCRPSKGKTSARLYVLWDCDVFGMRHLENLIRWNATSKVLDQSTWIEARSYLKQERRRRQEGVDEHEWKIPKGA
jgi:superfamily II DNA or RNA helicase